MTICTVFLFEIAFGVASSGPFSNSSKLMASGFIPGECFFCSETVLEGVPDGGFAPRVFGSAGEVLALFVVGLGAPTDDGTFLCVDSETPLIIFASLW